MVNPNKPIVNHNKRGKSMRSHGTAMANSAKKHGKHLTKNHGKLGIYHGFIIFICRGFICWHLPRSCSDLSWIDWVYHGKYRLFFTSHEIHPAE